MHTARWDSIATLIFTAPSSLHFAVGVMPRVGGRAQQQRLLQLRRHDGAHAGSRRPGSAFLHYHLRRGQTRLRVQGLSHNSKALKTFGGRSSTVTYDVDRHILGFRVFARNSKTLETFGGCSSTTPCDVDRRMI